MDYTVHTYFHMSGHQLDGSAHPPDVVMPLPISEGLGLWTGLLGVQPAADRSREVT